MPRRRLSAKTRSRSIGIRRCREYGREWGHSRRSQHPVRTRRMREPPLPISHASPRPGRDRRLGVGREAGPSCLGSRRRRSMPASGRGGAILPQHVDAVVQARQWHPAAIRGHLAAGLCGPPPQPPLTAATGRPARQACRGGGPRAVPGWSASHFVSIFRAINVIVRLEL